MGNKKCFAIEAGVINGWEKYVNSDNFIGMTSFGASGPYKELYKHFKISSENLIENIKNCYLKSEIRKLKLIHISTDEVYGNVLKKASNEEKAYEPNSPYAASKASVDHILRSYGVTYNIPLIIVNCCNNYGPYQFPEKFIPTVIINLLKKKVFPYMVVEKILENGFM